MATHSLLQAARATNIRMSLQQCIQPPPSILWPYAVVHTVTLHGKRHLSWGVETRVTLDIL
jgi:hypothetical protein